MRQPVIVLLGGLNLPPHDQEHDEDYRNLLRQPAYIRKRAQDIREELRQRVRLHNSVSIGQGREVGIVWPDQRLHRDAFHRAVLPVLQEVQQYDIKRARGRDVAGEREVGYQIGRKLGMSAAAHVDGLRLLGRGEVRVYVSTLPVVEEEVYAQPLIEGHLGLYMGCSGLVEVRAGAVVGVPAQMAGWRIVRV
jgi:hypothetical protein